MLKKEGKINDAVIKNMLSWRYSGFHVYTGDRRLSTKSVSVTWPGILSGLADHRIEWPMFRLKTQQMMLPK